MIPAILVTMRHTAYPAILDRLKQACENRLYMNIYLFIMVYKFIYLLLLIIILIISINI